MRNSQTVILRFFTALLIVSTLLSLTACGEKQPEHTHKWDAATCTRGELCWSCKETRGEALGHIWVDATCEKAKHCSRCGTSEGNALPHTSDGNGTCTVCKQALDPRILLTGVDPETKFHVYDGVKLSFRMNPEDGVSNRTGRFGKEYRIYDQTGTLVTQGEWVQEYYNTIKTDTDWHMNYYHDTDYIRLSPGEYRVEYSYYTNYEGKDNGNIPVHIWDIYFVGDGRLLESYNMLEVH